MASRSPSVSDRLFNQSSGSLEDQVAAVLVHEVARRLSQSSSQSKNSSRHEQSWVSSEATVQEVGVEASREAGVSREAGASREASVSREAGVSGEAGVSRESKPSDAAHNSDNASLVPYPVDWHVPQALVDRSSMYEKWTMHRNCVCDGKTRYRFDDETSKYFPHTFNYRPPCCFEKVLIQIEANGVVKVTSEGRLLACFSYTVWKEDLDVIQREEECMMKCLGENIWWIANENVNEITIKRSEPGSSCKYYPHFTSFWEANHTRTNLMVFARQLAGKFHVKIVIS
ncbi:hypothetical protein GNI_066890 [Gregarina niphandrodes]|uniref:Uncharacterized protein n=1 Tax=Gregarina niphandrodes TaxID=110365 RepID=A0A023B7Q2_GRENI|nr:hypothetical protein GNI_066890 [Gregarina niphandrodes]EZG67674.1 hypothetical protein GNI_066890 [Gregarina niphandrodes]|eukprot:XP_011130173.1 hypothetical protein GNI_066890 [Gregarina niphandrodes]